MKEAAGEANLTVIAILLIGVVAAVVTPLISGLMSGQAEKSCCQSFGGKWANSKCTAVDGTDLTADVTKCVAGE